MKKLLVILLFASCTPKIQSYEVQGVMVQQPVVIEEEKPKKDKLGKVLSFAAIVLIFSLSTQ